MTETTVNGALVTEVVRDVQSTYAQRFDEVPPDPFDAAKQGVELTREAKTLEALLADINERLKPRKALILQAMEDETFSTSSKILGANVHLHTQIWAGPVEDATGTKDHAALTVVLDELGLDELKPSTVNAQRFSAYIRELIKDTDPTLPLEERIVLALPPALAAVTKATEKREVRITGA